MRPGQVGRAFFVALRGTGFRPVRFSLRDRTYQADSEPTSASTAHGEPISPPSVRLTETPNARARQETLETAARLDAVADDGCHRRRNVDELLVQRGREREGRGRQARVQRHPDARAAGVGG